MKVAYKDSLKCQMLKRLKAIRGNVVLRKDLEDLGSVRQVSRGLRALLQDKKLVRVGFGIYAKAYASSYTDKPLIKGGIDTALRAVLNRMDVEWEPGSAEQAYNAGKTTQIPMGNIVKLNTRFRRQIAYGKNKLIFEKEINAR